MTEEDDSRVEELSADGGELEEFQREDYYEEEEEEEENDEGTARHRHRREREDHEKEEETESGPSIVQQEDSGEMNYLSPSLETSEGDQEKHWEEGEMEEGEFNGEEEDAEIEKVEEEEQEESRNEDDLGTREEGERHKDSDEEEEEEEEDEEEGRKRKRRERFVSERGNAEPQISAPSTSVQVYCAHIHSTPQNRTSHLLPLIHSFAHPLPHALAHSLTRSHLLLPYTELQPPPARPRA